MLKRIRVCNGISRVDLARDLGLAPSTAGIYVERLMAEGFLTESAKTVRETGRPPKLLHLNPTGGEFIGVDFEARNIMAVAVDFADRPLRHSHKAIEEGDSVNRIVAKIQQAVIDVLPGNPSSLLAIGIGVPGIVDSVNGIAIDYKFIPSWRNVRLAERLGRRFRVPVFLENTMRAMALAELWFGQGRGCGDFVCVCIRSGLGAGMVSNGRLNWGAHHSAGELGRWRCPSISAATAPYFYSGQQGGPELQDIASARSIQKALQKAIVMGKASILRSLAYPPTLEDVLQAAQQKDALTLEVVGQAANELGSALGNLALVVDPSKIILAGQLTPLGETFLNPVREAVTRTLRPSGLRFPEIVNSTMGEYIGALGAAALALHEWKPGRALPAPAA